MDTRDLIAKREKLQETILDSFLETFPQYEEMTYHYDDILMDEEEIQDWKQDWTDEIKEIEEIDLLEVDVEDFVYGVHLIVESDFNQDYVHDWLIDMGVLSRMEKLPYIEIDWESTISNVKDIFSVVEYQGKTYYYL